MPKASEAETIAFLSTIDARLAALADVEASCPFDPMAMAHSFIARLRFATNISQIVHAYAEAVIAVDPAATKAWRWLNAEVNTLSGPYGLAGVQRMATEINRNTGKMPASRVE